MSTTSTSRFLERNAFFNGQRLFASDLQAVEELNREMRWLHNQSLHQPGIGKGFATTGAKGDRQVIVQPGYAIDSLGREIVLSEAVTLPVPPVADDGFGRAVYFDLTVSYPGEPLTAAEERDGVCSSGGAVRLREDPVFCWVRLGPPPDRLPKGDPKLAEAVQNGLRLRLCRAQVLNCKLERGLSLAQRRNARPPVQPYVACGKSEPEWELIHTGFGLQLKAAIDTKEAGFRTNPCYTAHLPAIQPTDRIFTFSAGAITVQRVLDGFVTLLDASPEGFAFSLLIPDSLIARQPRAANDPDPSDPAFQKQLNDQVKAKKWRVEWMGVEG